MFKKILNDLYDYGPIIIIILIYLLIMQLTFGEICIIKHFFNFDCPGCGITRASIYLIKGQFIKAFEANWTVGFWWILIVLLAIDRYIHKLNIKILPNLFIFVCGITLIRYLIILI